jgi:DNA-binding PadR family transcriptional regulator
MFGPPLPPPDAFDEVFDAFRRLNATSPDDAVTREDLGLSDTFDACINGPAGMFGVIVKVDGKYYLSEEQLNAVKERMRTRHRRVQRLLRHTASVPKGFLRYITLQLLRDAPRSGSEIMEEIGRQNGGQWTPSPGSVYPLLAWLRDNGYTEAVRTEDRGIKRYRLTEKGAQFFEEQSNGRLQQKFAFTPPSLVGLGLSSTKVQAIREPLRRFMTAFFTLHRAVGADPSEQTLNEVRVLLQEIAVKLEAFVNQISEEKSRHVDC